jgi:hypothetical protein
MIAVMHQGRLGSDQIPVPGSVGFQQLKKFCLAVASGPVVSQAVPAGIPA